MSAAIDVVIIDSGGANLASLRYALDRLGARSAVSCDPALIAAAPRVLLPGVGAAADAMTRLRSQGLDRLIPQLRSPVLGGISRWDILRDKTLRRRLPYLFNEAPEIVTGVRAEEAQQVWADWNPLFGWAIKRLGFFVLP